MPVGVILSHPQDVHRAPRRSDPFHPMVRIAITVLGHGGGYVPPGIPRGILVGDPLGKSGDPISTFLLCFLLPSGNGWHSYWKWPFIVDFSPLKNGDFSIAMLNYQRVPCWFHWVFLKKNDTPITTLVHTKKYSIASTSPYLPYHMLIHSSSTDSNPLFFLAQSLFVLQLIHCVFFLIESQQVSCFFLPIFEYQILQFSCLNSISIDWVCWCFFFIMFVEEVPKCWFLSQTRLFWFFKCHLCGLDSYC